MKKTMDELSKYDKFIYDNFVVNYNDDNITTNINGDELVINAEGLFARAQCNPFLGYTLQRYAFLCNKAK